MKNYGRTSVYEFLGDLIVYRNLSPLDARLPALAQIRAEAGLPAGLIPRKSAPKYARIIVQLLRQARALDRPGLSIERLVYVGDTRLNDGTAFANICQAGGWPGLAFIGADRAAPPAVEIVEQGRTALYVANRWAALEEFAHYCRERGWVLDGQTAVIVDLDKTALGARGRNDRLIDGARVEAVRRTVGESLGERFDPAAFQVAYDRLNQPEFHPFTTDNQDYLAYVCLILGSGLYALEPLVEAVQAGRLADFQAFIAAVDGRAGELPADLRRLHDDILAGVRRGDPTPFKAFRFNEYRTTIERMGQLPDDASASELLAGEIVVTQEVRAAALAWRQQGALLFGLSDKPDEASTPTEALAASGYLPIHRVETHAIGD